MSKFLGIDIGGTNISFGVVNEDCEFELSGNIETDKIATAEQLVELIQKKVKSEFKGNLAGIGIGAPSVNHRTGNIEFAPNMNWGDVVPIRQLFETAFTIPVVVMNDANAAAIGEKEHGGAKNLDNFAVITLGTGVGLGLFLNGEIYTGENGLAGEIGHIVIRPGGRECKSGVMGCLEAYIGKNGIIQTAKEKLEFSSGGSMLQKYSPSDLTPAEIFMAARKEDPVALEVMDSVTEDLAFGLSMLVNILDIGTIFLTGGVTQSGNILRRKTEKNMKSMVLPNLRDKFELKISELNEKNGGILGAAAVARTQLETI